MSSKQKYTEGQTWGALRNCWKAFKIAKAQKNKQDMVKYAERIRTLQQQLNVPISKFPDLGLK